MSEIKTKSTGNKQEESGKPRSRSSGSQQKKVVALLKYLKENTDSEHKVNPEDIRAAFEYSKVKIGNPTTLHDLIVHLANALNCDEDEHPINQDDWKIVFDDYLIKEHEKDSLQIKNLYYNHEFSYEDIDAIVEAIRFSPTLEVERAERLVDTLETKHTSKYYKQSPRHICKVKSSGNHDRKTIKENLAIIQQAIDGGVKIQYKFNGYDNKGNLVPAGDYFRIASPYYLVADRGRYYLLAANDKYKTAYILRVDLMSDVSIPERSEKKNGIKHIKKSEVKYLPQNWEPEYPLTHYNMSYDNPQWITLRVLNEKDEEGNPIKPNYTFIHDAFGEDYLFQRVDKEDSNYDIVMIKCSPFGMFNFAMQYSDRVEVLEPKALRDKIGERVAELYDKYDVRNMKDSDKGRSL